MPRTVGNRMRGNDGMRCSSTCSECVQKCQQRISGVEPLPGSCDGCEFFQRLLLHGEVGAEGHVSGCKALVAEPERTGGASHPRLEEMPRGRVTHPMGWTCSH